MRNLLKVLAVFFALYGMESSAQTVSGNIGGYDYVDLGLPSGIRWATYNVGATKPIEYGDYFAWGETSPKEDYNAEDYNWNKYYGKCVLKSEDDAATKNWGAGWRMPTVEEQKELINSCNWETETDFNGSGIKVLVGTSAINGNKIILPAAGVCGLFYVGYNGYYWSSTSYFDESGSKSAYELCTHAVGSIINAWGSRYSGLSVRAVLPQGYIVSFYTKDSVLIANQVVEEGMSAKTVVAPILDGYKFIGWSDSSFTNVTNDMKIYALYRELLSFNVSFFTHDSVLIEKQLVKEGNSAKKVFAPTLDGYKFVGWSDSSFINVTKDLKVYAQYKECMVSGQVEGYDYVDLGLESGTLWATCNIGATKPTEYGSYFAWGEINKKWDYNEKNYKWNSADNTFAQYGLILYKLNKYCTILYNGIVDDKTVLEAADDAAIANWGSAWRMPTMNELGELAYGCIWWNTNDYNGTGVSGVVGISKTNGNQIFFPATGLRDGLNLVFSDGCLCWSSALCTDYPQHAYLYHFDQTGSDWSIYERYLGCCVRAVVSSFNSVVNVCNQALQIYAENGILHINNAQPCANIQLFDMSGNIVRTAKTAYDGNAHISLSVPNGVYVVTVGNLSTKVVLK